MFMSLDLGAMNPSPNILFILADDMGYSDIGAFGAEIKTPHLDALANDGLRMSSFYNCARCCPTRATILTGLYPHQAGIGDMVRPSSLPAYQGFLRKDAMTTAEVLKENGYATWCAGKWHAGGDYAVHRPEQWEVAGDERHPLPTQRGFERYYGTLCGAGSFFRPPCLYDQDHFVHDVAEDYYYTDAISDKACTFIDEAIASQRPFYGYLAHTAPHWPLHAKEEDIEPYRNQYLNGWDDLRQKRFDSLKAKGLLDQGWSISPRDEDSHPWEKAQHKAWEAERMAVYAAQVTAMDRGIGQVIEKLKSLNQYENTLIVFLSDNGGCAEWLREDGTDGTWPEFYSLPTNRGTQCKVGNTPNKRPGPPETFMSYNLPWANASNSPFRKFKAWTHEGGISTPFVCRWGDGNIKGGRIEHTPAHLIDLVATAHSITGAQHPTHHQNHPIQPLEGKNLLPLWRKETQSLRTEEEAIFWEHEDHSAMRQGKWKIVRSNLQENWQLHNMSVDRTELIDLAPAHPKRVEKMAQQWQAWANRIGVLPREKTKAFHL